MESMSWTKNIFRSRTIITCCDTRFQNSKTKRQMFEIMGKIWRQKCVHSCFLGTNLRTKFHLMHFTILGGARTGTATQRYPYQRSLRSAAISVKWLSCTLIRNYNKPYNKLNNKEIRLKNKYIKESIALYCWKKNSIKIKQYIKLFTVQYLSYLHCFVFFVFKMQI